MTLTNIPLPIGGSGLPKRTSETQKLILGLDPGTNAGFTYGFSPQHCAAVGINCATLKATKKRMAEPNYHRIGKFFNALEELFDIATEGRAIPQAFLIMESMFEIKTSASQAQIGHELRGAAKAFAFRYGIKLIEIQPNELKRFVTGKYNAEKAEMIQAARKHGYTGVDDNVADSIHLYQYGHHFLPNF